MVFILRRPPGPWFNIKMSSYQYKKSHLFWIGALVIVSTSEMAYHENTFREPIKCRKITLQGSDAMLDRLIETGVWLSPIRSQAIAGFLLTHWGRGKMTMIFQTKFSNAFSWMKVYKFRLRFDWSLFPRVQFIIFQHWPGDKPLSEPMTVSSLRHICVTRPQLFGTLE